MSLENQLVDKEDYWFNYETDKVETVRLDYLSDEMIKEGKEHGYALCPICKEQKALEGNPNYSKRKVKVDEDGKFGFCFRCNTKFYRNQKQEYDKFIIKQPMYYEYDEEDGFLDCSYIEKKLGRMDKNCFDYLINRNKFIDRSFISKYGLIGEDNKIIIPFYSQGKMIYYQIRFLKAETLKYFNPPIENKPFYCYQYNPFKPTIIVEGTFDAFAIMSVTNEFNVIAVLGLYITDYQYKYLKTLGGIYDILVMLDEGIKSQKLCWNIIKKGFRGKIKYVNSYGMDPEELLNYYGKEKFLNYIKENTMKLSKKKS